ncbi:MAG: hypothetical protein HY235_16015 [Acidobacteria bacterium]|nr:hypothetical protein [Acidobacteriota bacterium]
MVRWVSLLFGCAAGLAAQSISMYRLRKRFRAATVRERLAHSFRNGPGGPYAGNLSIHWLKDGGEFTPQGARLTFRQLGVAADRGSLHAQILMGK